jgi:hypothetical protein
VRAGSYYDKTMAIHHLLEISIVFEFINRAVKGDKRFRYVHRLRTLGSIFSTCA